MPVLNAEIAAILERYATLLEIAGANPFRVRAYRNAARTVADQPRSVAAMLVEAADLAELPDIGEDLAEKIATIFETGRLPELQALERKLSGELAELTALPGLGPKRVMALHRALGIDSLEGLRKAAEAGKLRALSGFGEKTEKNIARAGAPQRGRAALRPDAGRGEGLEAQRIRPVRGRETHRRTQGGRGLRRLRPALDRPRAARGPGRDRGGAQGPPAGP